MLLAPDVRYRLVVHEAHVGQVGPEAPDIDGRPMHHCGIILEHRTADADFDGRAGHPSYREAGWCPGSVMWCGTPSSRWQLVSFEPLELAPSIACRDHPHELHIFIRGGELVRA